MNTYRFGDLRNQGHEPAQIWQDVRSGELTRLRHGGYSFDQLPDRPEDRHLMLLSSTVPLLEAGSVISHASAGVLWGLPVPARFLSRVHTTTDLQSGGSIRTSLHRHARPLRKGDIEELDGISVTSLARTAIDLSCLVSGYESLAIMDAAWRRIGAADPLKKQVAAAKGRKGIGRARWALLHASPLAESPGESRSRYLMITHGVKMPLLQYEVRDEYGRLVARADFAWPEHGVLGEFDGRVKYERDVDAVMAEKRREGRLRGLGWWVLRWIWSDLGDGPRFAKDLRDFLMADPLTRSA